MSELLKTPSSNRDLMKREAQERKRNLLHLIRHYLSHCNLHETADCLAEEAQLSDNVEVCDNIDLDVILQEYQSYYFVKFQKPPKITKKCNSQVTRPTTTTKKRTSAAKIKIRHSKQKEQSDSEDFHFEIINLGNENNEKAAENANIIKAKPLCEFEAYSGEWREIAEQITRDIIPKNLGVKWTDCIGLQSTISVIKEAIVFPSTYPDLFTGTLTPFKGLLFFGPPGTGKTLLARALACEYSAPVINVTCSSYVSKWRGESEKLIKTLFDVARFYSPSIIFIDEVDAFVSTDGHQHEASVRFKSELLVQMDGVMNGNDRVFVFAVTNLPWRLDAALLRRFEKRVLVDVPDVTARRDIFKYYFVKNGFDFSANDLQKMAEVTENYSGSEIKLLCKEVLMNGVREMLQTINKTRDMRKEQLRMPTVNDVIKATAKIKSCLNENLLIKYREWNEKFGCL